ncbi:N-acetylmuramoyl-L-alanine amidase [Streptosporangium sp. NPDC002721]|uniref:peptidoglycan recognition protein family protein n=1 Tax=Streptosporangium sp. NPDC002721 TaxID=3366188 RepID=UPI0036982A1E
MKFVKRDAFGWGPTSAGTANPRSGLVIHYDGSNQGLANKPHSACRDYWVRTRKFHMGSNRGWTDIGYSFGACPHGYVFEGRGVDRVQAAQPGGNSTWYSCTLMSGPGEDPPAAQIDAVRQLRAWLMSKGMAAGVKGHRDFFSTSCPGDRLYRLVREGTFARPPEVAKPKPASKPKPAPTSTEVMVKKLPTLKVGDGKDGGAIRWHVKTMHYLLLARDYGGLDGLNDTVFSEEHENGVKGLQDAAGMKPTGVVDDDTWALLLRVA